ncbi:MAG TPA: helix-turn-helix domain-containing protein [Solirubrobacteraceae bacterium]
MNLVAHIGNIPVEEWLPFVVPVVALCLYVRRNERRRREAVRRLPGVTEPREDSTVHQVLERWTASSFEGVSPEHLPLLYPPGPDGTTPAELATRIGSDPGTVTRQLEDLAELGYLELEGSTPVGEQRAALTAEGMDLVNVTEDALLAAARRGQAHG